MRVAFVLVFALGCSSTSEPSASNKGDAAGFDVSTDARPIEAGEPPAVFAKYCQGTLLRDQKTARAFGAAGWLGNGSLTTPAGTKVILGGRGSSTWKAYAFEVDGTPLLLGDFVDGVKPDVDFTTTCTFDTARSHFVLLADAHFYSDAAMTLMPCTLPAGTEFPDHSYSAPGNFTSSTLETACGYKAGHTPDISDADLFTP
jgi:hypothetical protein